MTVGAFKEEDSPRVILMGIDRDLLAIAKKSGINLIGVADDLERGSWAGYPLFAQDPEIIAIKGASGVIIGHDKPAERKRLYNIIKAANLSPVTLIDGLIGPGSRHGPGLVMLGGAQVTTDCDLGLCVKINIGALVTHDVSIGDYTTIAPRAVILGRVKIGTESYIGANATILQGLTIGERVTICAGAVVTKDVVDGLTVSGNPARPYPVSGAN